MENEDFSLKEEVRQNSGPLAAVSLLCYTKKKREAGHGLNRGRAGEPGPAAERIFVGGGCGMRENMRAVVYREQGVFALEERPVPKIQDQTDAIVRVTLTSICSSDLHIKGGFVPRSVPGTIVGHEFVGVVEAVGEQVASVQPGDRVAVNVETFCGRCFFCQRGFVNNCTDPSGGWALGCRIDGGQAEYVRVPYADNGLTKIPDSVTDRQALFTGDILSTGYWAAQISQIQPGDTVLVALSQSGLCTMMCARLYRPAHILAVEPDPARRALALAQGWADEAVEPGPRAAEVLKSWTDGRGADVVLEAAGGRDTFQTAWQLARPNATVTVAAMYEEPQVLPLPDMYGKNLTFKTGGRGRLSLWGDFGAHRGGEAERRAPDYPHLSPGAGDGGLRSV